MLDVQCSMFDVHFLSKRLILNYIAKVSISIKLAPFLASGGADT
jgi:hypothetical protein